jgi:mannose/fructose/N-acetylgalactosamine-specific phosphotransferase system component IIC
LTAFVVGISESGGESPVDVAWAALSGTELVLVFGRDQARFRDRERRQIAALADIAAVRYMQTNVRRRTRAEDTPSHEFDHPSWGDKKRRESHEL